MIVNMVGMVHRSYYRRLSLRSKRNKPSPFTYHQTKGQVSQSVVVASVKQVLSHECIACGYCLFEMRGLSN